MINLILIPKIDSFAISYPYVTDFTYQYNGYNYKFFVSADFPINHDLPEGFSFDSSVLDEVISYTGKGLNLNFASYQGYFFNFDLSQSLGNQIFGFVQNAIVAIGSARQDLGNTSAYSYSWDFKYTGSDSNYPGHETYGTAYGFRFTGLTFENIDLVLDATGHLYGSQVLGNFTPSETTEEVFIWSIHQHDSDDNWWVPDNNVTSFNDLSTPYIVGKSLYWSFYISGVEHNVIVDDFRDTTIAFTNVSTGSYKRVFPTFYNPHGIPNIYIDGVLTNNFDNYARVHVDNINYYGDISGSNQVYIPSLSGSQTESFSFHLPGFLWSSINIGNYNTDGWFNTSRVTGSQNIFLKTVELTPDPSPPNIPVDEPINLVDIPTDPTDFVPTDDPQPVPGVDYPVPDPTPVPVPPLPPLVSGNDDLWPDVNGLIEVESGLDSYLGVLGSFEFTPLQSLVEGFVAGLTWVSMVMMTLYNGSDFSILFVVLSMFFIAACLLGIYKWWTH